MMLQNVTSSMISLKKTALLFMLVCMGMANVASATLPTPANFTVQFNYNSPYSAYVHWDYVSGADSYLIFWHNVTTGAWGQSDLVYGNSYTHYAAAGNYVEFNIWAVNSRTSEISNAYPSYVGVYMAPPDVTNLRLVGYSIPEHRVVLTWNCSSFPNGCFYVYRATNPNGPWTLIGSPASTANTLNNYVTPGVTYYYLMTAANPECWSLNWSNVFSFTAY